MRAPAGAAGAAPTPASPASPVRTLAELLAAAARDHPDRLATWLPRGRRHRAGAAGYRRTTFAQLDRRCDALAAGLTAAGVGPGVLTALLVPPGEDFFALAFALLRAGAVPVLVDPGIGARNLGACLGEMAPAAFIGVPRAHAARAALRWCPGARIRVSVGLRLPGAGPTLRDVERRGRELLPFRPPPPDLGAPAAVLFTSGSTGPPKGVEYRHGQFLAQSRLLRELYGLGGGDVSLATFPPFALFGPPLGMTTVVPRMDPSRPARVDPARILDAANTFAATFMFGSPALLDTVGRCGAADGSMPTLRTVVSAGAPVAPAVQRRFLRLLGPGAQVFTPYGATEALPVTSIGSDEILADDATGICVGRPVPGVDVALIEVTDAPHRRLSPDLLVPDGAVGEVVVRGPVVTASYARRPAATAAAKLDWDDRVAHRMGDVAYRDERGRLWFCGRKAHRVTTAAGTLYPVPCEAVFNGHPAVRRSALVGIGPPGRQRPVACVELEPGQRASAALTAELLHLAGTAPASRPVNAVLYHPGFPVDIRHNAKIDRPALARWAARRLR